MICHNNLFFGKDEYNYYTTKDDNEKKLHLFYKNEDKEIGHYVTTLELGKNQAVNSDIIRIRGKEFRVSLHNLEKMTGIAATEENAGSLITNHRSFISNFIYQTEF